MELPDIKKTTIFEHSVLRIVDPNKLASVDEDR